MPDETLQPINSDTAIVAWTEDPKAIVSYVNQVVEPESIYPGWMNLVSQCSIRSIAISPKSGHMWLATWGGVLLWRQQEENTYFRYSSEHGLLGNGVSAVCIDQDDRPWVCHQEGGLGYFENNRWHVYPDGTTEIFRLICPANAGGVWAATTNRVYHIPSTSQPSVPALVNNNNVQYPQALLDDGSSLLIGSRQGLFRLLDTGEVQSIGKDLLTSCNALARTRDQIWISTGKQLYAMKDGDVQPESFYEGQAGYVQQLAGGRDLVWLLTTQGISLIDKEWKAVSSHSLEMSTAKTIAVSSADRYLWVGTDSLLSSLIHSESGATSQYSELPRHREDDLSNLARCVVGSEKSGIIWLGNSAGLVTFRANDSWTIDKLAGDTRAICVTTSVNGETLWSLRWPRGFCAYGSAFKQPPGVPIALVKGFDGHAYGLTTLGLWRLGEDLKSIAGSVSARVRCICQTQDGTWWAGTEEGVYAHLKGAWSSVTKQTGPGISEIYALHAQDDKLWVGAENGFWCRNGNDWESHNQSQPRIVRAIAAAEHGKLWLAEESGVVRYSPDNQASDKSYSPDLDGLASNRVTALAEINGQLWIATEAGVSKLELGEEANK